MTHEGHRFVLKRDTPNPGASSSCAELVHPLTLPAPRTDDSCRVTRTLVDQHRTNLHLRFEFFPTQREVLAVSAFYKHFRDPIESTVTGGRVIGFTNAEKAICSAVSWSPENLGDLAGALNDFSILANFTLVKPRERRRAKRAIPRVNERPPANQSPLRDQRCSLDYSNSALRFTRLLQATSSSRAPSHWYGSNTTDIYF